MESVRHQGERLIAKAHDNFGDKERGGDPDDGHNAVSHAQMTERVPRASPRVVMILTHTELTKMWGLQPSAASRINQQKMAGL